MSITMLVLIPLAAIGAVFAAFACWWVYMRVVRGAHKPSTIAAMIWAIAIGATLVVALSSRDLNDVSSDGDSLENMPTAAIYSSQLFTLAALGFALVAILRGATPNRPDANKGGREIWLAFLYFFLSGGIVASIAGERPDLDYHMLYPLIAITGAYFGRAMDPPWLLVQSKRAAAFIIYASIVAAAAAPDLALERPYEGFLPGIDFRLHGLAGHANALGPIALIFLILEYQQPAGRQLHWLHLLAGTATLLLAQSKTSWISAVAIALFLVGFKALATFHWAGKGGGASASRGLPVAAVSGLIVAIPLLMFLASPTSSILALVGTDNAQSLSTFTGRTEIWRITLETWLNHPLFGYGPTLWDVGFRARYGLPYAGQAHNQFLETLGESGVVGASGLIVYLGALLAFAIRHAKESGGLSLALVFLLLIWCWSESPFRLSGFLGAPFMIHLIVVSYLFMLEKRAVFIRSEARFSRY